jgi:plasmid stabilization system protein ParE
LRIVFRPEAETELAEAAEWYEARAAGLGTEFLRALDAAIASIERQPKGYAIVFKNVRRALLRRFPYNVIYSASDDEILIVACIHGRRDPKRWQERA